MLETWSPSSAREGGEGKAPDLVLGNGWYRGISPHAPKDA